MNTALFEHAKLFLGIGHIQLFEPNGHRLDNVVFQVGTAKIGEEQVAKYWAELGGELATAGAVDACADEIGRNEVGGELDPAGRPTDHLGEGFDGNGLGETGYAFQEDVAAGEQRDQQALQQSVQPLGRLARRLPGSKEAPAE